MQQARRRMKRSGKREPPGMLMKTLGSKHRKTKKVQHAPEMYMKTKGAMTLCPVNYMPFTRKFAHGATIDKNRSDFFAEMHRSCDKSRRSGTGIPPVRGNVARASCPCPGMAKMAMPRQAGAGRSRASGRNAHATNYLGLPLCTRYKLG